MIQNEFDYINQFYHSILDYLIVNTECSIQYIESQFIQDEFDYINQFYQSILDDLLKAWYSMNLTTNTNVSTAAYTFMWEFVLCNKWQSQ